ncbi:hypothetical protein ACFQFH_14925 [Halobaculum halobium]
MPTELLRAHYARHGNLDDVVYFDCAEVLPALSFFDIRAELAAGVDRTTAVEDRVDHYLEILMQVMGRERFERAVRAPDIIRYLVKAMFDPVSGYDAYSHRQFHSMARQMHERRAAPPFLMATLNGCSKASSRIAPKPSMNSWAGSQTVSRRFPSTAVSPRSSITSPRG